MELFPLHVCILSHVTCVLKCAKNFIQPLSDEKEVIRNDEKKQLCREQA